MIPKEELAGYLAAAEAQANNYYAEMLIEDLKTQLGE
jgi:hypothetical protein